jgi:hypothetical protein
MALTGANISTAAVNTELGSPYTTPRLVSDLCKHANAGNVFSFYGPGTIIVDANKNAVWVAPSSNYKFGDFRYYNASATTPTPASDFTQDYPPSGSTVNASITTLPQDMNLFFINSGATKIYYKGYLTEANRIAESSPYISQLSAVLTSSFSALAGHTRTQTSKPQSPHIQTLSGISIPMPTTPNDYLYLDTFFADVGGSRLVNLGTSVAGGYTTITMHQQQPPYAYASGTTTPPGGYTAAFPVIDSVNTKCTDSDPTFSVGTSGIDFYFGLVGIFGGTNRSLDCSSIVIRITYDGSTKDVDLGALASGSKEYVSTTLPGGKSWAYDKSAAITVVSKTYTGGYTTC